jgi:DNA-binding LacI/PurR family transcriptional regulator
VALRRLPLDCTAALTALAADRSVTAVVLAGHDRAVLAALPRSLHGRVAAIGVGADGVPHADVDSARGIGALMRHLYARGRRRIALVTGPAWLAAAGAPRTAYEQVAGGAGLPVRTVPGDFTAGRGRVAAAEILRRWPDTDAIVTVSDATALGVLAGLAALGVRVPADVAVTGFDDLPLSGTIRPALTTATHPVEDIAAAAGRAALGEASPGLFPSRPRLRETS